MSKNDSSKEVFKIKANAKASKLVLAYKVQKSKHFNHLKNVISKIESITGVETDIPSEYKNKK